MHMAGTLAHELRQTETGAAFARTAIDAVRAEFGVLEAELVRTDHGAELRTVPDVVPADVASSVVNLWLVACRLEQLEHDASHDPLTGLLNRRSFDRKLAEAMAGAERYGWTFALVLVDLDGLKAINDEHGHSVGDAVLRTFGCELSRSVRLEDAAARLGGDEFALLVMEAEAARVTELLERVTTLVNVSLSGVRVAMSAGVAHVPVDGTNAEALYRLADERLYLSKRA
ncbi:MAG: hypothetical protein QOJ09_2197 [Actinomycetota bacterium]|nr:hypothetical protein [Actinomycetota bacterium]